MIRDKGTMPPMIGSPPAGAARDAAASPPSSVLPPPLRWLRDLLLRRPDHPARAPVVPGGVDIRRGARVETVEGVLGVVDRVLPDPDTNRVTHFVLRQAAPRSRSVVVPVGWAAESMPGTVRLVVDRAEVDTLPEYRPDRELTEAVLTTLRADPNVRRVLRGIISFPPPFSHPLREWAIGVRVAQGIVTLEGSVPARGLGSMAARLAGGVKGVRQVRDWLVADDDLQVAVAAALNRDLRTRGIQPRVRVDAGGVRLIGRASDEQTRAIAGEVATGVPGVRGVDNRLRLAF
jgi:hypothetical protein